MAKTNRENLCGAKVCELVSVSHIDFADYHVVMHASSLRGFITQHLITGLALLGKPSLKFGRSSV